MSVFTIFSKKGAWTLREAVELLFAGALVLGILLFGFKVQSAILTEPDDGSRANFETLYSEIIELVENSAEQDYKIINYFIADGKFLVGFDTNWDNPIDIYRPLTKCGNSACLCLYSGDDKWKESNKRNEELITCRSDGLSKKNVTFYSEGDESIEPRTIASLRPDGNRHFLVFDGDDWEIERLYIEKEFIKATKTNLIYITRIDENNALDIPNIRKKTIDASRNK